MGHAPGRGILMVAMADVEDFSETFGAIAVRFEILRQRDRIRSSTAKVGAQIVDAKRLRAQAGQQGVA